MSIINLRLHAFSRPYGSRLLGALVPGLKSWAIFISSLCDEKRMPNNYRKATSMTFVICRKSSAFTSGVVFV